MNLCSWEIRELCYEAAHKRFHDKLSRIIEPLVKMFTPEPPPTLEAEAETEVTFSPLETEIATISGTNPVVEVEPIPLILKTLEELKQENEVVRTRLDKQDDMFKSRLRLTQILKDCFKLSYQDCHPNLESKMFLKCYFHFFFY